MTGLMCFVNNSTLEGSVTFVFTLCRGPFELGWIDKEQFLNIGS